MSDDLIVNEIDMLRREYLDSVTEALLILERMGQIDPLVEYDPLHEWWMRVLVRSIDDIDERLRAIIDHLAKGRKIDPGK